MPESSIFNIDADMPHIDVGKVYGIGWGGVMLDQNNTFYPDAEAFTGRLTRDINPYIALSYTSLNRDSLNRTYQRVVARDSTTYVELNPNKSKGKHVASWHDAMDGSVHVAALDDNKKPIAIFHAEKAHIIN